MKINELKDAAIAAYGNSVLSKRHKLEWFLREEAKELLGVVDLPRPSFYRDAYIPEIKCDGFSLSLFYLGNEPYLKLDLDFILDGDTKISDRFVLSVKTPKKHKIIRNLLDLGEVLSELEV